MLRIVLVFLILVSFSFPSYSQNKSEFNDVTLSGLIQKTRVIRDTYGISHIYAQNEHDLFFMQGYVHAQDRLFQMDISRRQATGTLAELFGPELLESDVFFRTIGLRRAAERSLAIYSKRALVAARAYAEGVNAYLAQHPLPPEYAALEISEIAPWTELDVAVVAKLLAFSLSFDVTDIDRTVALRSYQQAGSVLGFDGQALFFEDLFRSQPFDLASTVPDALLESTKSISGTAPPHKHHHIDPVAAELCEKAGKKMRRIPYLRKILDRHKTNGSNEWVISGEFTQSGRPLLANDPHLELTVPSIFYPIHLNADKIDVIGSGFAGVPSVIVGHNRDIAWGTTFNELDVVDFYQEQLVPDETSPSGYSTLYMGSLEPVIPIPQQFRINLLGDGVPDNTAIVPPGDGVPAFTLIVPRRNQGPILEFDSDTGVALSVQYTGFSGTRELDSFLIIDSARNLDDFIEGLQYFDVGSENFVYADRKGNIGYFTSAEMPLREDLQANTITGLPPFFIRNGQGGNEWLPMENPQPGQAMPYEILPFEEMPQIVNPPRGWIINANNDPAGVSLDNNPLNQLRPGGGIFYLHNSFHSSYRSARITQLIQQLIEIDHQYVTFNQMQKIQADTVLRDAQVFTPYILQAWNNAQQPNAPALLAELANNQPLTEAIQRLSQWDFSTPTGIIEGYDASDHDGNLSEPSDQEITASIAATIYSVWRSQFIGNVFDSKIQAIGLPVPDDRQTIAALRHLLDNFETNQGIGASGLDFFAVPSITNADDRRDFVILKSLTDTLTLLAGPAFDPAFHLSQDQNDYRWGKLHRGMLVHPLGDVFNIPPAGGAFPPPLENFPGIPTDGGFQTVDAASHNARGQSTNEFMFYAGPTNRFVAALGEQGRVKAESIWPGGTSGVIGNPNYVNMLPLWLTNETIPLSTKRQEIIQDAQSAIVFKPDQQGKKFAELQQHPEKKVRD
jgi:penicillin amidase